MNAHMHQMEMREKTLLKSYLEVDMNEFFQQKIDSELFKGLDESEKAQFVGNFFHWVKCRFSDCGALAQKEHKKTAKMDDLPSPTAAERKARIVTPTSVAVQAALAHEDHEDAMKQRLVES